MAEGGQTVGYDDTNRARFVSSSSVDDSDLHQTPERRLRSSFGLKDLWRNKKKIPRYQLEQELLTYKNSQLMLNEEKIRANKTRKRCTILEQQLNDAQDKIRKLEEDNENMQPFDKLTRAIDERTNTEWKLRCVESSTLPDKSELNTAAPKKLNHDIELLEVLPSDPKNEHVITDGINQLKTHVQENNDSSQLPISSSETAFSRLVYKFERIIQFLDVQAVETENSSGFEEMLDHTSEGQAVETEISSDFREDFEPPASEYSDIYDNAREDYLIQNIIEVQREHNRSTASKTINIDEIRTRVRQFLHNKPFISNHEELTNVIMTLVIGDRGQADSSARDLKKTLDSSGTADWIFFVLSGNKKIAKRLLRMGKLPGQSTLDEISLKYGRKSKVTLDISRAICEYIKSKDKRIIDVWAAFKVENPDKICFVVCVGAIEESNEGTTFDPIRLDKIIEYAFVKRIVGEYSYESADILTKNVTSFDHLDDDAYFKLQECVAKYSVELMKDHTFLSVVSACNKRSRGYGLPSWKLEKQDCIVLYVHTKHYIPINEEPFEKHYGGVPVDVREGAFTPFGRTAKDYLEHLQIGCQIRGEIKNGKYTDGTLGCFLDHPQYGVCGLTCAHVLLDRWEMTQLKLAYKGSLNWPLDHICHKVFQPADPGSSVGHTVKVVYKEGTSDRSGMDVALFKITSRHPKNSEFPQPSSTGSSSVGNIYYEHWRICSESRLNKKMKRVVKFGAKTEMSDGEIEFGTTTVKELTTEMASGYYNITLQKQIEVRSKKDSPKFAAEGDSGALVFVVGESNSEHTCIGIVEGGTSYGTVVVTPILQF